MRTRLCDLLGSDVVHDVAFVSEILTGMVDEAERVLARAAGN